MPFNIKDFLEQKSIQQSIKSRYAYLLSVYKDFIKEYFVTTEVYIDRYLLQQVILSWEIDEHRHIDFHHITTAKHYKQASYFVYWFLRFKPIQAKLNNIRGNGSIVNEHFALYIALNLMGVPHDKLTNTEIDNIIYSFHYRVFTPENLFLLFELLQKISLK